jgi:hypothetical protein
MTKERAHAGLRVSSSCRASRASTRALISSSSRIGQCAARSARVRLGLQESVDHVDAVGPQGQRAPFRLGVLLEPQRVLLAGQVLGRLDQQSAGVGGFVGLHDEGVARHAQAAFDADDQGFGVADVFRELVVREPGRQPRAPAGRPPTSAYCPSLHPRPCVVTFHEDTRLTSCRTTSAWRFVPGLSAFVTGTSTASRRDPAVPWPGIWSTGTRTARPAGRERPGPRRRTRRVERPCPVSQPRSRTARPRSPRHLHGHAVDERPHVHRSVTMDTANV